MEELSFGGVVRKKWHDVAHPKVYYPTNFQTPKSKKKFLEEKEEKEFRGEMSFHSMVQYSFPLFQRRSCPKKELSQKI